MTKHALEIVEFKLKNGVTDEAFRAEIERSNAFLKSLTGFIDRKTAQNSKGIWIDVVRWQDMQSATEAVKIFQSAEDVREFNMMIDSETTKMQHFEIEMTM